MLDTWARMARKRCDCCGTVAITWMRADELCWLVAPEDRVRFFELMNICGNGAESWICQEPECRNWGIFGPTHLSV